MCSRTIQYSTMFFCGLFGTAAFIFIWVATGIYIGKTEDYLPESCAVTNTTLLFNQSEYVPQWYVSYSNKTDVLIQGNGYTSEEDAVRVLSMRLVDHVYFCLVMKVYPYTVVWEHGGSELWAYLIVGSVVFSVVAGIAVCAAGVSYFFGESYDELGY
eukprot:TRINITY_DN8197_c0_g1_i1.p1 TRINITY_DN8197_c0_g1~~TRINITY_DN8197_c0_g1_i1.p1  ORF type:complete len:157 (-),score=22.08 TRINITY_DN8197_c0_g1_i1:45-515(-)